MMDQGMHKLEWSHVNHTSCRLLYVVHGAGTVLRSTQISN